MQFEGVWRIDWKRTSAMQQPLHRTSLVLRGFVVESARYEIGRIPADDIIDLFEREQSIPNVPRDLLDLR